MNPALQPHSSLALASPSEVERRIEAEVEQRVEQRVAKLNEVFEAQRRELTEARQSELARRAAESRWYAIFSQAAVGLCEFSLTGMFERVNDRLCRMLGRTRGDLLAMSFVGTIHPEDAAESMTTFREVVETGVSRSLDVRCTRNDATLAWATIELTRLQSPQGTPVAILAVMVDFSERRRTQIGLRKSESQFRAFFELAALGISQVDAYTRRFLRINERFSAMLGYSDRELRQLTFMDITHPDDVHTGLKEFERAVVGEIDAYSIQKRLIRKDQSMFWALVSVSMIRDERGKPISSIAIVQDVTERIRAETELRQVQDELELRVRQRTTELDRANQALLKEIQERKRLEEERQEVLRQLASSQEDERRRISRELHDEVGQHLTALILGLKTLQTETRPGARFVLSNQLQRIAESVGKGVHDLARELRPTALDDLGLLRTIANYVEEWSQRTKVDVDFHSSGLEDTRLPTAIETTLYRIVQEALHNVIKHAKATRVSVILERHKDHAFAIVEDNGTGFDPEIASAAGGSKRLGIVGMRERARLVDGEVRIESSETLGTSVFVRVPLVLDPNEPPPLLNEQTPNLPS